MASQLGKYIVLQPYQGICKWKRRSTYCTHILLDRHVAGFLLGFFSPKRDWQLSMDKDTPAELVKFTHVLQVNTL